MKEYRKYMKKLMKDPAFTLEKSRRKRTEKITHSSGEMYTIHPGQKAIGPLSSWVKRVTKNERKN